MIFYHNTTDNNANAILADGFRDTYIGALGEGIWLTDDPDYMRDEAQLSIDIPSEVMGLYRLQYEDQPAMREWFAPANVLNGYLDTLVRMPWATN